MRPEDPPENWHGALTWTRSTCCKVMVAVRENLALNGRQRGEASGEASGLLRRGKL